MRVERVEAVQRAHRRAAGDLTAEVVDAAVARADELARPPRRSGPGSRGACSATTARCTVELVVRLDVDRRVALAHVRDRLAGLADARDDRDHLGDVVELGEVVGLADDLPLERLALEDRAEREAQRGQRERGCGDAAGAVRDGLHEAAPGDGLTLEGPRHSAVGRVLRGLLVAVCWHLLAVTHFRSSAARRVSLQSKRG